MKINQWWQVLVFGSMDTLPDMTHFKIQRNRCTLYNRYKTNWSGSKDLTTLIKQKQSVSVLVFFQKDTKTDTIKVKLKMNYWDVSGVPWCMNGHITCISFWTVWLESLWQWLHRYVHGYYFCKERYIFFNSFISCIHLFLGLVWHGSAGAYPGSQWVKTW